MDSDQQLVADYLAGDEKSLEILIKQYLKPIYSFIYRYVGSPIDAEDVTQEVFIKAWRSLKKPSLSFSRGFDPKKGSFKTWIFSIAKNASIDWLKKKKAIPFSRFENDQGENLLTETLADSSPLPDELLERAGLEEMLKAAIKQLTLKYRMVLLLRYNDCLTLLRDKSLTGLTFREIAGALGESLNTVKSRHRRALIALKKLLIGCE